MKYTKIGIVLGSLVVIFAIVASFAQNSQIRNVLLAIVAITVLVGAGNWLNSYLGIERKPQEFNQPDRKATEPEAKDAP
jgi:heme O synthase-like polyprenyltransferase